MRSLIAQFIKNELDAYNISDQRAYADPVVVGLIVKAFEAYDEYKRLVSSTHPLDPIRNPITSSASWVSSGKLRFLD